MNPLRIGEELKTLQENLDGYRTQLSDETNVVVIVDDNILSFLQQIQSYCRSSIKIRIKNS